MTSMPGLSRAPAGLVLPYPQRNFDMEFSFSWLYIIIEVPRLFLGALLGAGCWVLGARQPAPGLHVLTRCAVCARAAAVSKGNKTEQNSPLLLSYALAVPLLAMYAYFIGFQTYV